jgi:UDP-N-acetylglucosamine 2-epimerase (non-hydrolysing)
LTEHPSYANASGPIITVIGTRPEIIKFAPIIKECSVKDVPNEMIHTGQHYSYELDSLIFQDLSIEPPKFNLKIGSGSHAEETARALLGLEELFRRLCPRLVLVLGDTNSTLAGALAASKLHIPVGHVEAGLRSFDRDMVEEKNRILTDHISDILFAPTETSAENLAREGIPSSRILVTGNTIVDAVRIGLDLLKTRSGEEISESALGGQDFVLLTLHREENVDREERLRNIIKGVAMAASKLGTKAVFPAHPRTIRRIKQFGISIPDSILTTDPKGYLDFLRLERDAKVILTDSGGVQEEACTLGVPCVTLRTSTERPETIKVGANILAGLDPEKIASGADFMVNERSSWSNPLGDGSAGTRIVDSIIRNGWRGSS